MNISIRSYYIQFITGLALCILIIVVGYEIDIKFLYKKLGVEQKQIQNKNLEIQQNKSVRQKQQLLQTLPKEKYAQSASAIEMVNILNVLEKKVVLARVTANLFEPEIEQENKHFIIYPIKLELDGTYKNLLIFINSILQLPYLITIEDLSLQKKKDIDTDDLNMQILLMVYKNKYPITKNISNLSIPVPERDIFKQGVNRKNLYLWSSKELQFLGIIKHEEAVFGIVNDPIGNIYRVMVGDKIGLNQSKIVAINKCGITTTKQEDNIYRGEKCI